VRAVPLDDERLPHIRKIEIRVPLFCRPDLARFDASVIGWGVLEKRGFAPIQARGRLGFEKSRLVSFWAETVLTFASLELMSSVFQRCNARSRPAGVTRIRTSRRTYSLGTT